MANDDEAKDGAVHTVRVEKAQSKSLSYTHEEIIHETGRTRVTALAWLVDHQSGDRETSIKIRTEQRKRDGGGVLTWLDAEQKTITLAQSAVRALVEFAKRAGAVAQEKGDGSYIAIRTTNAVADVASLAPETVSRTIAAILQKKELVAHLAGQELGAELVHALRGAIHVRKMKSALLKLRTMLQSGEHLESKYQEWFEQHSWAFGSAYQAPDSIRQIARGDTLDLLVPSSLTGLRDVIELKRPNMDVIRYDEAHKNWYWSKDASMAIGQCHRYLDTLHEVANKGLNDYPEIIAYRPRATVVIGRSSAWTPAEHRALHGLNSRLSGIQLITYDQMVSQGERMLSMLSGDVELGEPEPPESDEPPF